MNRKTLSIFLDASMCLPAPPAVAFAQENDPMPMIEAAVQTEHLMRASVGEGDTDPASDYKYTVSEDTVTITGLADDITKTALAIPAKIEGKKVTVIGENAFTGCSNLKSVTIPEGVKTIGKNAFSGCSILKGVTIPSTVETIEESAFQGCLALESISIPDDVKTVGKAAFSYCKGMTSVSIGTGIAAISERMFHGCDKLESVTIPGNAKSIGNLAFRECAALKSVTIQDGVTSIGEQVFENCGITDITIPTSINAIGDKAFDGCAALKKVTYKGTKAEWESLETNLAGVPDNVPLWGAKIICTDGDYVNWDKIFEYTDGTDGITIDGFKTGAEKAELEFPAEINGKKVTAIKKDAFEDCTALKSVEIPANINSVGAGAFYNCINLKSATIAEGVKEIGTAAFEDCSSLESANIPGSVKIINPEMFWGCTELKTVDIAKGVETICNNAFKDCKSLTSIRIPDSVTQIDTLAFYRSGLTDVTLPSSVTTINSKVFNVCRSLKSAVILGDVKAISNGMFYLCSKLTDVTLPESVETIGEKSFAGCSSLPSIILPKKVKTIMEDAFQSCNNLKMVYYPGTQAEWDAINIAETGNGYLTAAKVICDFDGKLTVTFDANGGTFSGAASFQVALNKTATQPDDPIREGYTFAGWYQDGKEWDWKTPITDHITLTAKWTQNSTGGSSSGGSSSGGSSSGGSNSSASVGASKTETTKNDDGSTTTTTTDKNGTVTEKTEHTDGTVETVETRKDGTVIKEIQTPDGTTTKTRTNPDGATTTEVQTADGTLVVSLTDADGTTTAEVSLSQEAVSDALQKNETVTLPIPAVSVSGDTNTAPSITVDVSEGQKVKIEIPVKKMTPGTVLVMVLPDGTEQVLPKTNAGENGVSIQVEGNATFKVLDRSKDFDDVQQSDWFAEAASFASARGLFSGTSENEFSPYTPANRGMLLVVLYNLESNPKSSAEISFWDVNDQWYAEAVGWAVEQNIVSGYSDGSFGAEDSITREQLAVILYNYMGRPQTDGSAEGFADSAEISGYAQQAMQWAVEQGILNGMGDGTLQPKGEVTRAQLAIVMMNLVNRMA